MEKLTVKAQMRNQGSKSIVKKLRREGFIPAILYGRDIQPVSISVGEKEWGRLMKDAKKSSIFEMELNAGDATEMKPVMVKEVQRAFPRGNVIHIDFLQVSMERLIEVEIPVHLAGEAKGQKLGGLVEQHLRTVKVECLPAQIPESIVLDVTSLEIGDSIHVGDITIPGAKLLEGADIAVVTVIPPDSGEARSSEEAGEKKEE